MFRIIEYKSTVWNCFALADVEYDDGKLVHVGEPILAAATYDDLLRKIGNILEGLNKDVIRMEL